MPLALVFLVASVPFAQAAVSVKVGDTIELPFKMYSKIDGKVEVDETGTIKHVVTTVAEGTGVIAYEAKHTMTFKNGTEETFSVANVISTEKSDDPWPTQEEVNKMNNLEKSIFYVSLGMLLAYILATGDGLIINEGLSFSYTIDMTEGADSLSSKIDAKWGDDGRLVYFYMDSSTPEGDVAKMELGKKGLFDSIPGFPVEALLGFCALSILVVMKKYKKVE